MRAAAWSALHSCLVACPSLTLACACRGALLAILSTAAAVVLCWTLPNVLADATNFLLPMAYLERQGLVLTMAAILANALTTIWLQ